MSSKKILLAIFICNGFFLLFDRFLKYQAVHDWSARVLWGEYFGWYPYFNYGIGFGLPVPKVVTIIITIIILSLILYIIGYQACLSGLSAGRQGRQVLGIRYKPACPACLPAGRVGRVLGVSALPLIFFGALSNLIDRVCFGYTVDYFFILTGYINLADVMIVVGFILFFAHSRRLGIYDSVSNT
ncbi:MAG: signal peptidase II [Candidatus Magasanikbacteria bacterium]|jgi:lipoprotein signal peptidase